MSPSRSLSRFSLILAVAVAVAGLFAWEVAASAQSPRERMAGLGALPATYAGLLPCADCLGIRYQINLLPGGAYMQRMTYLREGSDQSFYELGAWSLSNDSRTLWLDGGQKTPARWAVQNAGALRKLDRGAVPAGSERRYELTRSASVEPMQPRVRLVGMFRYQADAPRFRDCRSGLSWPVEMSGGYPELERAYGSRRSKPGAELMVSVQGRIEPLPRMDGASVQPTLVVEKFVAAMAGQKCGESASQSGLANTRWRPVRIGDQIVTVPANQGEPWFVLEPVSKRVTGSGGCNRISGSYEAGQDSLRFGPILSTKMGCPALATETALLRALGETRRYRVLGRTLELLDGRGRLLARLEESNLK